jgi:hypothetical protein
MEGSRMGNQTLSVMAVAGTVGVWSSVVAALLIPPIRWCLGFSGITQPPLPRIQFVMLFLGLFCYVLKGLATDPRISPIMAAGLFLAVYGLYLAQRELGAQQHTQ